MKRMFYYAKLNSDNVCVGFASYPKLYENVEGLIPIPDYNESYLYKKWEGNQWSQDTFEPTIPVELQDKIEYLENIVESQNITINSINEANQNMIGAITLLEGTIMELTTLIANLQGGM